MVLSRATRALWNRSPRENWSRLANKPVPRPVWTHAKHAIWNRLPYYLTLFDRLCREAGTPLTFAGKDVLEIGCGPVLGLAPFLIVEGAASVALVEPNYTEIRGSAEFRDDYLYPLWASHTRIVDAGVRQDFEHFMRGISETKVFDVKLEKLPALDDRFDVITSKSCLEHIADLPRALEVCHAMSKPGSLNVHYVDFSMHREADRIGSPFGLTYSQSRADNPEYLPNRRGMVNLLRASEVTALFAQRFRTTRFFPLVDYKGRLDLRNLHAEWARFDEGDLSIASGVIIAIK